MHALVIGGTGMLLPVVKELAEQGYTVSVIARQPAILQQLENDQITGYTCDYHDTQTLIKTINQTISDHGPIDLTVAWIHSTATEAAFAIAKLVTGDFLHILSASAGNPEYRDPFRVARIKTLPNLSYRRVILGFIPTQNGTRWLSNEEIASGILSAFENKEAENVVGTVTPWNNKPHW